METELSVLIEAELEVEHPGAPAAPLRNDGPVAPPGELEPVQADPSRVEDEVLRDPQPGEDLDVARIVLRPVAAQMDLQGEVEPLALVRDQPPVSGMGVDVEHHEEVGGDDRLSGVVDRELAPDVDAPTPPGEVLLQRLPGPLLGDPVVVALRWARRRELGRERVDDVSTLLFREPVPEILRRRPRVIRVDAIGGAGHGPLYPARLPMAKGGELRAPETPGCPRSDPERRGARCRPRSRRRSRPRGRRPSRRACRRSHRSTGPPRRTRGEAVARRGS